MPTPRSISDPMKVKKLVNVDLCVSRLPHMRSSAHSSEIVCVGARAIVTCLDGLAVVDFSDPANAKTVASLTSLGVGTYFAQGEQGTFLHLNHQEHFQYFLHQMHQKLCFLNASWIVACHGVCARRLWFLIESTLMAGHWHCASAAASAAAAVLV